MSIFAKNENESTEILSRVLADSYVLLMKTQNVHWNVEGSDFRAIHLMTEEHYRDLSCAIDIIAERIRMIGAPAPATFEEFKKLASFEDRVVAANQREMLQDLLKTHEAIRVDIISGIQKLSESEDFGTIDVLNSRLYFHEKTIWMLKATLENK